MRYELRPMGLGEILDRGLRIYLSNLGRLLPIALVVLVPLALLGIALDESRRHAGPQALGAAAAAPLIGFAIGTLGGALLQGALIQAVSDLYLGKPAGLETAFGRAFRRAFPMIGAALLSFLVIAVGFVLLIVPGILWTAALFCVNAVVILEGKAVLASFRRSRDLTRGFRKKVLALISFAAILSWIWGLLVAASIRWLGLGPVALTVLVHAATVLFAPFSAIVTILLYYDLRVRKEAFDLEVLAREMGTTPA